MNSGFFATLGAFLCWGVFPLYWRLLGAVPASQIMAHRIVWCFGIAAGWLTIARGAKWWRPLASQPRLVWMLCVSALLIALNWWLYIWSVNNGHVVESSLGYFINPLVNVLLGVAVLKERLNPRQWLSVVIATTGVAYLTAKLGQPPWIALALAISFGCYGLIRKVAPVESIPALGFESGVLFVPALAYLVFAQNTEAAGFLRHGLTVDALLVASGLVTAIPLVLFAYGAQRIPYSLVGILQYVGPTLQLICGIWVFHEPFTHTQAVGFGLIWLALAVYAGDGLLRLGRAKLTATPRAAA